MGFMDYQEVIDKCQQLNEKYQIEEEKFYSVIENLANTNLSTDQKLMASYQQLLQVVSNEITEMEEMVDLQPTCQMGCAFCCYFPIVINEMEAKIMKAAMEQFPKERKQALQQHFNDYYQTYKSELQQIDAIDEVDDDFKYSYKKKMLPCVMLDTKENKCLAYEIRPIPCRTYVNYITPKVCEDNLMPKETISYEFFYQEYMGALNEFLQYLYEEEDTGMVTYPDDLYREDLLINWMKDVQLHS
ncbi:YkgJ family cysteine cluster protein [Gracilibacillus massiliensis]|uniref:YkgJ family cysteine cluster protein n=1 Tax=Gracilibacillus massiliensis TaxID=1564956 RepID=UPI00071D941F|nr:YkgJ family cysteine cluster protein [Gracilibacillus massiliensis]